VLTTAIFVVAIVVFLIARSKERKLTLWCGSGFCYYLLVAFVDFLKVFLGGDGRLPRSSLRYVVFRLDLHGQFDEVGTCIGDKERFVDNGAREKENEGEAGVVTL
jgi:hypothetical protein